MTRSFPSYFENSSATSTNLCVLKYVCSADMYRTLLSDILLFRYCKTMVDLPTPRAPVMATIRAFQFMSSYR